MATSDSDTASATLIQLADTLASDYDVFEYLDMLLQRTAETLGATAGGVMLANSRGDLELLAATDEPARLTELFELQRQQGPSVDCYRRGEQIEEHDLGSAVRWPRFAPAAVAQGYRASFAFPMRLRQHVVGALNVFHSAPGPADPDAYRTAQAFAHMAAIGILQERAVSDARQLAGQLQTALNSRVVIEQAKGIIGERSGVDMGEAFAQMRRYARNHNLVLREVAGAVVGGALATSDLAPGDTS